MYRNWVIAIILLTFSCVDSSEKYSVLEFIINQQYDKVDTTFTLDGEIQSINYYDSIYLKSDIIIINQLDESYSFDKDAVMGMAGKYYHNMAQVTYDSTQEISTINLYTNKIEVVMDSMTGEAVISLLSNLDSTMNIK